MDLSRHLRGVFPHGKICSMHNSEKLESLNSLDLDSDLLAERIEMSALLHAIPAYSCLVNVVPGKPIAQ